MTQVSLLSGVLTNNSAEFVTSYPLNMEPLIVNSGISKGQLRAAAGAVPFGTGPGPDRGGIVWNDVCYRVMGTSLVTVGPTGAVGILGDVGGSGPVTLDYSFDRLIIRSDKRLYYWDGTSLSQVTDTDLGDVIDVIWIDGYTMATDGNDVVVTELSDPFSVKPLKYASAESDPDPITGLIKSGGEAYVLGRNTIQVFQDQGGSGFPFANVPGATIETGCVSPSAKTLFGNTFAFVGSARGDALGVYVAGAGKANKISTREVDDAIGRQLNPAGIVLERRVARDELRLLVHLADETWIFLAKATEAAQQPVWYRAQSGLNQPYRLRGAVIAYNSTIVGDLNSGQLGQLSSQVSTHFGSPTQWQFDVGLLYNNAKGALVSSVELVGTLGRGTGTAFMSMSADGLTFGQERACSIGMNGNRAARAWWRPRSRVRGYMGIRFRGYDTAVPGFAACEVTASPLSV